MKKLFSLLLILVVFCIASCEKLDELISFTITDTSSLTIKANSGINIPFVIPSPEITTSSEQAFKNNNTRADLVDEATLESLELLITAPDDQTFDFLNEIEIYIKAEGLEEALLASRYNIPENTGNSLSLESNGVNLKEYIKKESYSIKTRVVTDKVITRDIDLDVQMKFRIKAKVF